MLIEENKVEVFPGDICMDVQNLTDIYFLLKVWVLRLFTMVKEIHFFFKIMVELVMGGI